MSLRTAGSGGIGLWSNPLLSGRPDERLNVLIILEDALRADHLSRGGLPLPTTPVKDHLSQRGVAFDFAFAQSTKTRSSCPSLMTSLYPTAHGVWHFQDRLHEAYVTLAEVLRAQGYRTASFTQNGNGGAFAGLEQGFDQSFGPMGLEGGPSSIYGPAVIEWLEANRGHNFFLYLHVLDPHGPYDPPEPFRTWYQPQLLRSPVARNDDLDPAWVVEPTAEGRRILYASEVRHNDTTLLTLLQALETFGLSENTLLVFVSDHGEHLGERGIWGHKPPGFAQVLRVPLLLVHPGRLPAGRRVQEPVQLVDVMPTILDLLEIQAAEALPLQGDSLLSLARGENASDWERRLVWSDEPMNYMSKGATDVWASLVFGRWHFLRSRQTGSLVFDYRADSDEKQPRSASRVGRYATRRVEALMAQLKSANMGIWQSVIGGHPETVVVDAESQEELRALGYIE